MHLKESEGNTSAVGVFTYFPYALVYYTILRDTVKIIKDVMHHACRSFNQVQHTQFDIGRVYDVCLVHRGEKNTGQGYTTLISLGTEPTPPPPPSTPKKPKNRVYYGTFLFP